MKLTCECGQCGREHDFFEEYTGLIDLIGGFEKFAESQLAIILKDCDNGGFPFLVIAETENLKMGASLPKDTNIYEFSLEEFHPLRETIWN